jgi:hypothetical protein
VKNECKGASQMPEDRLYTDIIFIINACYGGSKFGVLIVINYIDFCWSLFLKYKAYLKDEMFTLFTDFNMRLNWIGCECLALYALILTGNIIS